jgi:hypothetical protein
MTATYPSGDPSNKRNRRGPTELAGDRELVTSSDRGQDTKAIEHSEPIGAADRLAVDHDLRHRRAAGEARELAPEIRESAPVDLVEGESALLEQRLGTGTVPAPRRRVHGDLGRHLDAGHV